ncbi:unnamed protein product [Chrysoparadoxa australica]
MLVKMMALMMGKLVKSFGPLLAIIYLAWSLARYTLLSQVERSHSSITSSLATQYPEALGEFSFSDINDEDLYQSWRFPFMVLFTVVVVIVMLNLLVSLLNDLYEELKTRAKADWCRAQAVAICAASEAKTQAQQNQSSTRGWLRLGIGSSVQRWIGRYKAAWQSARPGWGFTRRRSIYVVAEDSRVPGLPPCQSSNTRPEQEP